MRAHLVYFFSFWSFSLLHNTRDMMIIRIIAIKITTMRTLITTTRGASEDWVGRGSVRVRETLPDSATEM